METERKKSGSFDLQQSISYKLFLNTLHAFLFNFLFSQSTFKFYSIYTLLSRVTKQINQTKNIKKIENFFIKNERIESSSSQKRALDFDRTAPSFDKRALG